MNPREFFHSSADGARFIRFSNTDGKSWIMPLRGMATAMHLYQPSEIKGRLVKKFLPYIYWIPFVSKLIHSEIICVELSKDIYARIKTALGVDDFQFAIFEGTPSVHQKATIQIWKEGKILGYCKVSESDEIGGLFERESRLLNQLHSAGVNQVPRGLLYDKAGDFHVFVQSTVKTDRSKTVHHWTQRHSDFIILLHEKTKAKCLFEESGLAKSLAFLEGCLGDLPQEDGATIAKAIGIVRTHYQGSEVEFSAYHGDFTPWNMFFEKDRLFVFDFEYSDTPYPPFLDRFHFFTQTSVFEKHMEAEDIFRAYCEIRLEWGPRFVNPDLTYISYLLSVMELYLAREKGELPSETKSMLKIWIFLLNKLGNGCQ